MTGNKPIIFLYPLSVSLKKYLDLVQETQEEEKIDIYEVDDLNEAAQIVPTIGPSLVMASSPKKCAQMLQQNKVALKANSSKVLLLSEKELPNKIVQKLQKFGLTQYLQEPVNPKSLLYKVGLLLKALPIDEVDQVETEEDQVFKSDEPAIIDSDTKQRVEKGIILDDEPGGIEAKSHHDIEIELINSGKKEKEHEIELNLESGTQADNKNSALSLISDEEEDAPKTNDNEIDTYYKNIKDKDEVKLEISSSSSKESDEKEGPASEFESDVFMLSDSDIKIDIESSPHSSDKPEEFDEDLSMHLKDLDNRHLDLSSDINKEESLDLKMSEADKKVDHEIDDLYGSNDQNIEQQEDLILNLENGKKVKAKEEVELTLSSNKELKDRDQDEDFDSLYDIKSEKKLDVSTEDSKRLDSSTELKVESESNEDVSKIEDTGDSEINVEESDLNLNIQQDKNKDNHELTLAQSNRKVEGESDDDDLAGDLPKRKGTELDIKEQDQVLGDNKKKSDEENIISLKDSSKLKVDSEEENENHTALEIDGKKKEEDQSHLNLDDTKKKAKEDELDLLDSDKKIKAKGNTIQIEGEERKVADDVELKLSAGKKLDKLVERKEYDWEKSDRKKVDEDFGPWVSRESQKLEIDFEKKASEEVIDYRALRKQFDDAALLEREKRFKKDHHIDSESDSGKAEGTRQNDESLAGIEDLDAQDSEEEEEEEIKDVHEPKPRGVEFIVKIFQMYLNKRSDAQIFLYISNVLYKEFGGITGFFLFNKEKHADEIYSAAHNIEYSGNRQVLIDDWEKEKKTNRPIWQTYRLPHWSDHKFIKNENQFTYPYFEGVDHIGFSVVNFPKGITAEQSNKIEMILEGARGIFLQRLRDSGIQGQYGDQRDEGKEKKGLLGKFFGKK